MVFCDECIYWERYQYNVRDGACRRYPETTTKDDTDRCGEGKREEDK